MYSDDSAIVSGFRQTRLTQMASLMGVDPRLAEPLGYRFQTPITYNNAYTNQHHQNTSYFTSIAEDENRYVEQIPQPQHRQHVEHAQIAGLYRPTSIPETSRGFNPGTDNSTSTNENERQPSEIKDPTIYVPPHLLAPMKPNPPSLKQWRDKFFNIDEPLLLTPEQYLTYFPHVDNIYSHRSTQKYKRKPFVSHYWDCRLKGRPTGTPMNKQRADGNEPEKKKRKRKVRERDLCDVKIKVTEYFGKEELEALRKLGLNPESAPGQHIENENGQMTFVINNGSQMDTDENADSTFGVLEPAQNYPPGHPGYGGKKWYMVQRVNGTEREGEDPEERDLDHKHTIEDSDRIKKNSVQRWLLAKEKERKKAAKSEATQALGSGDEGEDTSGTTPSSGPLSRFHASGTALQTLYSHHTPVHNHLTFYGSSFCPFAQRIWIALEFIGVPYQYVELQEQHWAPRSDVSDGSLKLAIPELADINIDGNVPCLKHNNFAVWESLVMLEYLEDLDMGKSLFPLGGAQLKAHSRLWVDFINRRILPVFYALILLPEQEKDAPESTELIEHLAQRNSLQNPNATRDGRFNDERYALQSQLPARSLLPNSRQRDPSTLPPRMPQRPTGHSAAFDMKSQTLINTLHKNITTLVNASHCTGPYFMGSTLSYVDIAFAPWIIRLSRVLSYYRGFPRPEVGTRWQAWCEAIENDEVVRRTVSEEKNYRDVYGAMNSDVWEYDGHGRVNYTKARSAGTHFPEMAYARKLVDTEGFGLGGDIWGKMGAEYWPGPS